MFGVILYLYSSVSESMYIFSFVFGKGVRIGSRHHMGLVAARICGGRSV